MQDKKNYIIYRCNTCHKSFILPAEEVDHENNYITCPHHGKHRNVSVIGCYDDIQSCLELIHKKNTYKKSSGAIKQKSWES